MNTQERQRQDKAHKDGKRRMLGLVLEQMPWLVALVAILLLLGTTTVGSTLFWVTLALMWVLLLEPIAALMGWIENPFRRIWEEAKRQHPEP